MTLSDVDTTGAKCMSWHGQNDTCHKHFELNRMDDQAGGSGAHYACLLVADLL